MHVSLDLSASRGLPLDAVEYGQRSAPPLVLLHGLTDSWRAFLPLIALLSDSFRVVALTLRGHGDSPKPAAGYDIATLTSDVEAALDVLGCGPALVVGHSLGSVCAQRLAVDRPDLVAGLVLIGAFVNPSANAIVQALWEESFSTLADPLDPLFGQAWQESASSADLPAAFMAGVVEESLKVPAHVWRAGLRGLLDIDLTAEVARIKAPVLGISGGDDAICADEARHLQATLPLGKHATLPGMGHSPHWQDPQAVAAMIVQFMQQTALSAAA
jgi:non-heme chloroperoxidase